MKLSKQERLLKSLIKETLYEFSYIADMWADDNRNDADIAWHEAQQKQKDIEDEMFSNDDGLTDHLENDTEENDLGPVPPGNEPKVFFAVMDPYANDSSVLPRQKLSGY